MSTVTAQTDGLAQAALDPDDIVRLALILTHADLHKQTVHLLLDPNEGGTAGLWISLNSEGYTTVEYAADHIVKEKS